MAITLSTVYAQTTKSSSYPVKNNAVNIIPILNYHGINYRYDAILHRLSITPSSGARAEFIDESPIYYLDTKVYKADAAPYSDVNGFFISIAALEKISPILFDRNTKVTVKTIGKTQNILIEKTEPNIPPPKTQREENLPQINENRGSQIEVIIIDAGHGGKDYGAIGVNELPEKEVTLNFALALSAELKKQLPKKTIELTRDKDIFLSLDERSRLANKYAGIGTDETKNAMFISVHANASINKKARGFESYFLTADESSEYARSMATFENNVAIDFENKAHIYTNYSKSLYYRMLIEQYQKESRLLAELITREVLKVKGTSERKKTIQSALFYVLKGSLMPAVLLEIGFITNPVDAKLMTDKKYKEDFTKSVAKGIITFINQFEKTNGFTD